MQVVDLVSNTLVRFLFLSLLSRLNELRSCTREVIWELGNDNDGKINGYGEGDSDDCLWFNCSFDTRSNQFLAECLSWCLSNNMSVNGGRQLSTAVSYYIISLEHLLAILYTLFQVMYSRNGFSIIAESQKLYLSSWRDLYTQFIPLA